MPGPRFQGGFLLAVVAGYLLLLFGFAYLGERKFGSLRSRGLDRYVYALAAGVYCTSWTLYGCIGNAAQAGPSFLALFLGPSVFALAWWSVLRKIVRFCRTHNVTSVPDLLSVRYGGAPWLGALATLFLVAGLVPCLALQFRAVGLSYETIASGSGGPAAAFDIELLVAVCLGVFALVFGGRHLDFTRPQGGILTTVAAESVVTLLLLLAAGVFACYGVFGGMGDLFGRFLAHSEWRNLAGLSNAPGNGYARWGAYFSVAAIGVLLLPGQFHILVAQNGEESHIRTAMWMFPLYLLLFNLFVIPIAFAGLLLGLPAAAGDRYVLAIPMLAGSRGVSLLVFLGGCSAATAMVLVSSVALGKMAANNLVIPAMLRAKTVLRGYGHLLSATRGSILAIVALGFLYARLAPYSASLMEIGVISLVAVAQFGPAVFGGMYWKGGNAGGAGVGLCAGFAAWFYTLVLPAAARTGILPPSFVYRGPFGVAALRPTDLLAAGIGDPVGNAVFWSLFVNVLGFVAGSLLLAPADGEAPEAAHGFAPAEFAAREDGAHGAHCPSLEEIEAVVARYAGRETEKDLAGTREPVTYQEGELRARERLLAGVVHSIDDGIVAFDADGRITAVNEGGCRLFRREERAMIGGGFHLLIRDTPYRERQRIIARATYRNGHWRGEVDILRGDGTQTPGLVSTARIRDERGKALGFVASFKDLAELKAMQAKMIQTEKLASLGQMAAGVAHEIRTPLGSIKMSTRLLGEELAGPERGEVLGTIREAVSSMEIIVNELLDYTRDIALQLDDYDLAGIARSSVFELEEECRRRGVAVAVDPSDARCSALVDGVRIKQVLTNIVKNAIEASPGGEGRVRVRLSGRDDGVRITVEDNGPGMTEEELSKVFQPFYTNKAQGVGLGMPIVRRLVELHGGEVRVVSEPGKGTAVSVDLPRYPFADGGRIP